MRPSGSAQLENEKRHVIVCCLVVLGRSIAPVVFAALFAALRHCMNRERGAVISLPFSLLLNYAFPCASSFPAWVKPGESNEASGST